MKWFSITVIVWTQIVSLINFIDVINIFQMLKSVLYEFSVNLDVKSDFTCAFNSIVLGCSTINFFDFSSIDDILVWYIIYVGLHGDRIVCDAKSDMWSNDSACNSFHKYLVAIGDRVEWHNNHNILDHIIFRLDIVCIFSYDM